MDNAPQLTGRGMAKSSSYGWWIFQPILMTLEGTRFHEMQEPAMNHVLMVLAYLCQLHYMWHFFGVILSRRQRDLEQHRIFINRHGQLLRVLRVDLWFRMWIKTLVPFCQNTWYQSWMPPPSKKILPAVHTLQFLKSPIHR